MAWLRIGSFGYKQWDNAAGGSQKRIKDWRLRWNVCTERDEKRSELATSWTEWEKKSWSLHIPFTEVLVLRICCLVIWMRRFFSHQCSHENSIPVTPDFRVYRSCNSFTELTELAEPTMNMYFISFNRSFNRIQLKSNTCVMVDPPTGNRGSRPLLIREDNECSAVFSLITDDLLPSNWGEHPLF